VMGGLNAEDLYGKPRVFVTRGDEATTGESPVRFNPKLNRNQFISGPRKGQIAPTRGIQKVYNARVGWELFPSAGSGSGASDRFINKLPTTAAGDRKKGKSRTFRQLVAYGEYGTKGRPGRPFVTAFAEFYNDAKASAAIERALV